MLFTRNPKEILCHNLNHLRASALPDGRFVYAKLDPNLNDALLLTNTSQGYSWTATYKVERPFRNGWNFAGSATTCGPGGRHSGVCASASDTQGACARTAQLNPRRP